MTGDTTQCQWYGGVPPPFHVLSIYDSFLLFHPWLFLRITCTTLSIRSPRCFVRALCGSDTAAGRYPPNSSINLHLVHWAPCRAATVLALVNSPYRLQAIFLFAVHLPPVFLETNVHMHMNTVPQISVSDNILRHLLVCKREWYRTTPSPIFFTRVLVSLHPRSVEPDLPIEKRPDLLP